MSVTPGIDYGLYSRFGVSGGLWIRLLEVLAGVRADEFRSQFAQSGEVVDVMASIVGSQSILSQEFSEGSQGSVVN